MAKQIYMLKKRSTHFKFLCTILSAKHLADDGNQKRILKKKKRTWYQRGKINERKKKAFNLKKNEKERWDPKFHSAQT